MIVSHVLLSASQAGVQVNEMTTSQPTLVVLSLDQGLHDTMFIKYRPENSGMLQTGWGSFLL